MNYEEMSNDEIAVQVLNCTGYKSIDCGYGYEIFLSKESRKDVGIKASGKFKFDPCNNPSDAWPIILANKIAVCPYDLDEESEEYEEMKDMWFAMKSLDGTQFDHKNPLRAAMIVFLMVEDAKNAD